MARRRSGGVFLVVNVIVSLAVASAVIIAWTMLQEEEEPARARPTFIVVYSPTPDPSQPLSAAQLQGTLDSQAGTLVALERAATSAAIAGPGLAIPTQQSGGTIPQVAESDSDLPTIDPALIPELPPELVAGSGGDTSIPAEDLPDDGCERYFVAAGDTAGSIATRFEVGLSELFVLNEINDQTVLQIGDELLIPGESCEPEVPPTATPVPQPTFNLTIVAPTATLAQVAADSQVEIVQILNPGDITAEQVEIQNLGGQINLLGWTLTDGQGNVYTFPDVRLVPGSVIRISTRSGTNTPGFLYWNQDSPVWELDESATLSNAAGVPQSIFTVGQDVEIIDFDATATP
jgi:LysM repeat protein